MVFLKVKVFDVRVESILIWVLLMQIRENNHDVLWF